MLACLHSLGGTELETLAGLDRVRAASAGLDSLIRFAGPASGPARPATWLIRPAETREDRDARVHALPMASTMALIGTGDGGRN
jgi:hypothetical protein